MNNNTAVRRLNEAKKFIHPYVDFHTDKDISDDRQISINQVYLNIRSALGLLHRKQGMPKVFNTWFLREKLFKHSKKDMIMSLVWSVNNWRMLSIVERNCYTMPSWEKNLMMWISEEDYKYFNERFQNCVNAINNGYGDDHSGSTY